MITHLSPFRRIVATTIATQVFWLLAVLGLLGLLLFTSDTPVVSTAGTLATRRVVLVIIVKLALACAESARRVHLEAAEAATHAGLHV